MEYARKFNLRCHDVLKEYFTRKTAEYSGERYHVCELTDIPQEITDMFRDEMTERGLPDTVGWLMFKKRGLPEEHPDRTHVDSPDNTRHVSIVIPIEGCEDTHMYWCEGDYHFEHTILDNDNYVSYSIPIWDDVAKVNVMHREKITSPTICRVDIPHDTVTRADDSYRVVVTTRFVGDPSFEEVCEKLSK